MKIELMLETHLSDEATVERDKTGSPPVRQAQPGFEPPRVVRLGRFRQRRVLTTISKSVSAGPFDIDTRSMTWVIGLVMNFGTNKELTVGDDIGRVAFSLTNRFISCNHHFDNKVGTSVNSRCWNERYFYQAAEILWRAQEGQFRGGDSMLMINKTGRLQ